MSALRQYPKGRKALRWAQARSLARALTDAGWRLGRRLPALVLTGVVLWMIGSALVALARL